MKRSAAVLVSILALLGMSFSLGGGGLIDDVAYIQTVVNDVLNAYGLDVLHAGIDGAIHGFVVYDPASGYSFTLGGAASRFPSENAYRPDCVTKTVIAVLATSNDVLEIAIYEQSWESLDGSEVGSEIGATLTINGEIPADGKLVLAREDRVVDSEITLAGLGSYLEAAPVGATATLIGSSLTAQGASEAELEYTMTATVQEDGLLLWDLQETVADQQALTLRKEHSQWTTAATAGEHNVVIEMIDMQLDLTAFGVDPVDGSIVSGTTSYALLGYSRDYEFEETGSRSFSTTVLLNAETNAQLTLLETARVVFEAPVEWTMDTCLTLLDDVLYDSRITMRAIDPLLQGLDPNIGRPPSSIRVQMQQIRQRSTGATTFADIMQRGLFSGVAQVEGCAQDGNCGCEDLAPPGETAKKVVAGTQMREQLSLHRKDMQDYDIAELVACIATWAGIPTREALRIVTLDVEEAAGACKDSSKDGHSQAIESFLHTVYRTEQLMEEVQRLLDAIAELRDQIRSLGPRPTGVGSEVNKQEWDCQKSALIAQIEQAEDELEAIADVLEGFSYEVTRRMRAKAIELLESRFQKATWEPGTAPNGFVFHEANRSVTSASTWRMYYATDYGMNLVPSGAPEVYVLEGAIDYSRLRIGGPVRLPGVGNGALGGNTGRIIVQELPLTSLVGTLLFSFGRDEEPLGGQPEEEEQQEIPTETENAAIGSGPTGSNGTGPCGTVGEGACVWSYRNTRALEELGECNDINPGAPANDFLSSARTGISVSSAAGKEGEALSFTISRAGCLMQTSSVDYLIHGLTASAGADFIAHAGVITFANGEDEQTIEVALKSDELFEEDETLKLTLSNPVNAELAQSSATGTIEDVMPEM